MSLQLPMTDFVSVKPLDATHVTGKRQVTGQRVQAKMAEGAETPSPSQGGPTDALSDPLQIHEEHRQIALAVAALLKPTIAEAVQQGLACIQADLASQARALQAAEQRISDMEDTLLHSKQKLQAAEERTTYLLQKVDDLENRSRRSNLKVVGVPESYPLSLLHELCEVLIPQALGMATPCVVERAHRLGPQRNNNEKPRTVIAKYLNYADKAQILQSFRKQRVLNIQGHALLLFADYSAEVSRKRKAFANVCSQLHQQQRRFTLAYPATLLLTTLEGDRHSFTDPDEAEKFLRENGGSKSPRVPQENPVPLHRQFSPESGGTLKPPVVSTAGTPLPITPKRQRSPRRISKATKKAYGSARRAKFKG